MVTKLELKKLRSHLRKEVACSTLVGAWGGAGWGLPGMAIGAVGMPIGVYTLGRLNIDRIKKHKKENKNLYKL